MFKLNKSLTIGIFVTVAFLQLLIPIQMITSRERILDKGTLYKFRTRPVDPYDAFRGKYVALSIDYELTSKETFTSKQRVYVTIKKDADGFAHLDQVYKKKPANVDCIKAKIRYKWRNDNISLKLPFERYYMEENDALRAEKYYQQYSGNGEKKTYIAVKVSNSGSVIEELYVDGLPILEFLKKHAVKKEK
jgi:uncharacterized membrane-anchored protein